MTAAGHRVVAVEIQSAPRGIATPAPDPGALQETLAVAANWDWCGASLAIEHCDAFRAGRPHAKGFCDLQMRSPWRATSPLPHPRESVSRSTGGAARSIVAALTVLTSSSSRLRIFPLIYEQQSSMSRMVS